MQDNLKKKLICSITGNVLQKLRGEQSQFKFCSENDISISIISMLERGLKDPQLTTIFKIAEAHNLKASELIKLIENELPEKFMMIEK